jgi:hypothetical protein
MIRCLTILLSTVVLLSLSKLGRSDVLVYQHPNSPLFFVLQGKVAENKRDQSVSITDPAVGSALHFPAESVQVYKVDTIQQEFSKKSGQAGRDANQLFHVALWALKHGMVREFHATITRVLEAESKHPGATRVAELKKKLETPLPESTDAEAALKRIAGRGASRIEKSSHFLLATDTSSKPDANRKKTRARERLDLMEKSYECFLYWFHAHDLKLEPPKDRLLAVLLKETGDYSEAVKSVTGLPAGGHSGVFDRERNLCVFLDQAGDGATSELKQSADKQRDAAAAAKKKRDPGVAVLVRSSEVLGALAEMAQDGADVEAVSREVARQMAVNCGLFSPGVEVPIWIDQGLARFFEFPREAPWSGFGAASELRLAAYRALDKASPLMGIEAILGDQLSGLNQPFAAPTLTGGETQGGAAGRGFGRGGAAGGFVGGADGAPGAAARPGFGRPGAAGAGFAAGGESGAASGAAAGAEIAIGLGEAQAWALTHHLMDSHPKQLIEFYRAVGGMRPDVPINPEVIVALFEKSLGKKPGDIDKEWRSAMRPAKSEVERLTGRSPLAAATSREPGGAP